MDVADMGYAASLSKLETAACSIFRSLREKQN